jgi:hypothetical protein
MPGYGFGRMLLMLDGRSIRDENTVDGTFVLNGKQRWTG